MPPSRAVPARAVRRGSTPFREGGTPDERADAAGITHDGHPVPRRSRFTAKDTPMRRLFLSLLLVPLGGCIIEAPPPPPPPARVVERVPPPPPGYYAWRPGHWRWNGYRYVWVPGHYVARGA